VGVRRGGERNSMLGFLLAGGEGAVIDSLETVTALATPTATAEAVVYDGLVKSTGIQWGTIVYYAVGIVAVLLLVYLVYTVVKLLRKAKQDKAK